MNNGHTWQAVVWCCVDCGEERREPLAGGRVCPGPTKADASERSWDEIHFPPNDWPASKQDECTGPNADGKTCPVHGIKDGAKC